MLFLSTHSIQQVAGQFGFDPIEMAKNSSENESETKNKNFTDDYLQGSFGYLHWKPEKTRLLESKDNYLVNFCTDVLTPPPEHTASI